MRTWLKQDPKLQGSIFLPPNSCIVFQQGNLETGRKMQSVSPTGFFSGFFLAVHLVYLASFTLFFHLLRDWNPQSFCFKKLFCLFSAPLHQACIFLKGIFSIFAKAPGESEGSYTYSLYIAYYTHTHTHTNTHIISMLKITCSAKSCNLSKWSMILLENPVYSLSLHAFAPMDSSKPG